MNILHKGKGFVLVFSLMMLSLAVRSQFYHGMRQPFGKNRVQYESFDWQKIDFPTYTVFFYGDGKNLAVYAGKQAAQTIEEIEQFFDYPVRNEQLQFVVYHKLEQFRQSNVGIPEVDESTVGGNTQIAGNKIFLYYNGDLNDLNLQIRQGVSEVLIAQMLFGDNWREMIKNSTLLSFPEWFISGLTQYATKPWDVKADDQLRDIVLRGKYRNFNRLHGNEALVAGRSLWYYIGETYGSNVIPNIIYMARVSRNIESGFLFVLGISLNTLLDDAAAYFQHRYEQDAEGAQELNAFLDIRTKKGLQYSEPRLREDGAYLAYASNDLSKTNVWIYDQQRGRRSRYLRFGHRLDRVYDQAYPIMDWNPVTGQLVVIQEKRGQIWMYLIDPENGVESKREILRLEKVLEMEFSADGKEILFSAISRGQCDLYLYSVAANSQRQLTDDVFDDRHPSFWGPEQVMFSSNRTTDTLNLAKDFIRYAPAAYYDLYALDLDGDRRNPTAMKLTSTTLSNETESRAIDHTNFLYLSDESGIPNRYRGYVDSAIVSIDTSITYRYFTETEPVSAYGRSIRETDYNAESRQALDIIYFNERYRFQQVDQADHPAMEVPFETGFRLDLITPEPLPGEPQVVEDTLGVRLIRQRVFDGVEPEMEPKPIAQPTTGALIPHSASGAAPDSAAAGLQDTLGQPDPQQEELIDIRNYTFESEAVIEQATKPKVAVVAKQDTIAQSTATTVFQVPEQRNYELAFAATDLTTQFNFDYATDLYQPFDGGPYVMPGLGTYLKVGMLDVFEDYKLEGGFRYNFNNTGTEYFISLEDRSKRLDRKYIVQRQTLSPLSEQSYIVRTYLYQARGIFRYALDEVNSLQLTTTARYDRLVYKAYDDITLARPNDQQYYVGVKGEYIFDNTLDKGLNILNGARAKVFAEHYREMSDLSSGFTVVGLDARHYQPIHRDLIWANRLAASSSFGGRKLVYYMGAVDNWIVLSNRPRFDETTNVPDTLGYAFQTIATNMRGFMQNARNGNNFVVFNSEIRWPVVRYFTDRPIKSEFISNLQVIGFLDVGTAWNGPNPYSDKNAFNNIVVDNNAVRVTYKNQSDPIIAGTGFGFRSMIWGYFVRLDYAWGIENGLLLKPIAHVSFGLDF